MVAAIYLPVLARAFPQTKKNHIGRLNHLVFKNRTQLIFVCFFLISKKPIRSSKNCLELISPYALPKLHIYVYIHSFAGRICMVY